MSKQTLKFNDTVVNKKDFYASKKAIPLKYSSILKMVETTCHFSIQIVAM